MSRRFYDEFKFREVCKAGPATDMVEPLATALAELLASPNKHRPWRVWEQAHEAMDNVYGISTKLLADLPSESQIKLIERHGRKLAFVKSMHEPQYFTLAGGVWFIKSATQCEYCGKVDEWVPPPEVMFYDSDAGWHFESKQV